MSYVSSEGGLMRYFVERGAQTIPEYVILFISILAFRDAGEDTITISEKLMMIFNSFLNAYN